MKQMYRISLIVIIFLGQLTVNAQTNVENDKMQVFSFLTGNWSVENFMLNNDKEWELIGSTSSKNILVHDGKFVNENVKYLTAFGEINMITFIGYDSRIKSYKLSAMDKEYGVMDIYLGEISNKEIVFTNLNSDAPFIMENGQSLWFKLTYKNITDSSFTHLVEGTTDKGKTWFSFSKAKFKKSNI
jgi:hypothetical protein